MSNEESTRATTAPDQRDLLDADGENRAVRTFLMQYGVPGLTVAAMAQHMRRSGWESEYWPDFARQVDNAGQHLTKAGAQIWIRHLFSLELAAREPEGVARDLDVEAERLTLTNEEIFESAAPWFKWNAESWHEATKGAIGMPELLSYTKAVILSDRAARGSGDKANSAPDEVARLREELDLANEHLRQAVESIAKFRAGTHHEQRAQANSAPPADDRPCTRSMLDAGLPAPRTCPTCKFGPCKFGERAPSAGPAGTQAGRAPGDDAERFAWLVDNPKWGKRGRLKNGGWQWQMIDEGEPWGEWGDYRKVLDAARKAYPSHSPVGAKEPK